MSGVVYVLHDARDTLDSPYGYVRRAEKTRISASGWNWCSFADADRFSTPEAAVRALLHVEQVLSGLEENNSKIVVLAVPAEAASP